MVTAVMERAAQHEGADVAYWLTRHLARINWRDGSLVYCKACDAETAMRAVETPKGAMLECGEGHRTHPANILVSKGLE